MAVGQFTIPDTVRVNYRAPSPAFSALYGTTAEASAQQRTGGQISTKFDMKSLVTCIIKV